MGQKPPNIYKSSNNNAPPDVEDAGKLFLAAAEDAAKLYTLGCKGVGASEATVRLRVLRELSRDLRTETLLMLSQACSEAHAAGELEGVLRGYLAGPVLWSEASSWNASAGSIRRVATVRSPAASSSDEQMSSAVRECIQLFIVNMTRNPVETALRMRALQSLSEGISTHVIELIGQSVVKASSAGVLDQNLTAFLNSRLSLTTDRQSKNDQPSSGPSLS